jgi:hypothetical protein
MKYFVLKKDSKDVHSIEERLWPYVLKNERTVIETNPLGVPISELKIQEPPVIKTIPDYFTEVKITTKVEPVLKPQPDFNQFEPLKEEKITEVINKKLGKKVEPVKPVKNENSRNTSKRKAPVGKRSGRK